jgi:LPXTG-motif cell wall-anchored protein
MTSPNPKRRAAAGAGAALTAAAFAVGLTAAPALAQPGLDIEGWAEPVETSDFYVGWSEETERQGAELRFSTRGADDAANLPSLHVEFGIASNVDGLTFETENPACIADGSTITCDFVDVYAGADYDVDFDVLVGSGINAYDQVEWDLSIEPSGYDAYATSGTWEFLPLDDAEWDYDVNASDFEDVAPGTALTPAIEFANVGEHTYTGVIFSFWADDPYLSTVAEYGNCGMFRDDEIWCALPDLSPAPGEVYELSADTPVTVTLGESAPGPIQYRQGFQVAPLDSWGRYYLDEIEFFDADQELAFELTDRTGVERSQMTVTSAVNPFDMTVAEQRIDGEAGESTTLPIVLDNLGPADALARAHPGSGEGRFHIAVQLPTGVKVTGVDEYGHIEVDGYYCSDAAANEWMGEIDPAVYQLDRIDVMCWGPDVLLPGEEFRLDLPVAVTGSAASTDGLVSVMESADTWDFTGFEENWGLTEADYPTIDADLDNNVAALTLNAAVPGGGGSGQLPSTGVSLTVIASAAAAALAVGAVAFVVVRRRKAAADW